MAATEYRDADFDFEKHIDKTSSWSDGLQDLHRFVPNMSPTIRKTSSADDISRYYRYFELSQSNQGELFTWKHYLHILREDLRRFDTLIIMSKMLLLTVATPVGSEISNYVTASESDYQNFPPRKEIDKNKRKRRSFQRKEIGGDAESISSVDSAISNASLTPQTNLLKKMCSEIRTLARKTCKTVEKMSSKSKYCSSCGDYIGNIKIHKKCAQQFGDVKDCSKPLTPDMIKRRNALRTGSMIFDTPVKNSGSETSITQSAKMTYAPHARCRMKPFIKRSPRI